MIHGQEGGGAMGGLGGGGLSFKEGEGVGEVEEQLCQSA